MHRAGHGGVARLVAHLQQKTEARQPRQDPHERRGEARMVDERRRVGIVEQIDELVLDVPVVDVERGDPGLERPEHRFEVLRTVVEVDPEMVLAGLPIGEGGALAAAPEAAGEQEVRETAAALGDVRPAETPIAMHDAFAVGKRSGERFVDGGEVERHGGGRAGLPRESLPSTQPT